jgi:hypothetical protein
LEAKKNKKQEKKLSKNEARKVKRLQELKQTNFVAVKDAPKPEIFDLWGDSTSNNTKPTTVNKLAFPKVPIPHPGQSYNPSKQDLTQLLKKVVELSKKPELEPRPAPKKEEEIVQFDSDVEEDKEFIVSINPAVDDFNQRKSRKEKNKQIKSKLNRIKDLEMVRKKQVRIKLSSAKGLKRIEKERQKELANLEKKLKEERRNKLEKEQLINSGIIEE